MQLAVLSDLGEYVADAAYSPDGQRIVIASASDSSDQVARIWDAATVKQIAGLSGHDDVVRSVAFSPDARRIVTASNDRTARIWDAASGVQLAVLSGHGEGLPADDEGGNVRSAAFSPDGRRIVTASNDKTARIWDAATARQLAVLSGHDHPVRTAAFSPDGRRIVTASADQTARIWDAATAKPLEVLSGHARYAFGPPRTRPTGGASSPPPLTTPRASGTRTRPNSSPSSPATAMTSGRLHGRPMGGASSPPPPTIPCESGTRPPACSSPYSPDTAMASGRLRGRPMGGASSPPPPTRPCESGTRTASRTWTHRLRGHRLRKSMTCPTPSDPGWGSHRMRGSGPGLTMPQNAIRRLQHLMILIVGRQASLQAEHLRSVLQATPARRKSQSPEPRRDSPINWVAHCSRRTIRRARDVSSSSRCRAAIVPRKSTWQACLSMLPPDRPITPARCRSMKRPGGTACRLPRSSWASYMSAGFRAPLRRRLLRVSRTCRRPGPGIERAPISASPTRSHDSASATTRPPSPRARRRSETHSCSRRSLHTPPLPTAPRLKAGRTTPGETGAIAAPRLARLLAREGMMSQVADAYIAVRDQGLRGPPTWLEESGDSN